MTVIQNPKPDCAQWTCTHISVYDRVEGKTCATCPPCDCS